MKKICKNCKNWIPLIDNGQCYIYSFTFCEYDDNCEKFEKLSLVSKVFKRFRRNK